jgi:excinuclease UvrABC nuclease subunit
MTPPGEACAASLYSGGVLDLACGQEFEPARDTDFFAALPPRPAVFRIEMHPAEARPYLGRTADLRRRLKTLLETPDGLTKRLNLRELAARVRYRLTGSPFEQALTIYQQAVAAYPHRYRVWMRLRPPALLKLKLASDYPRCYVTRRLRFDGATYFGPFPTRRAADNFLDQFLNLYKIRRCQIKIRRDPSFPGCIYSEMKMCLAPCFAGCTEQEYGAEVGRVASFLGSAGSSLTMELEKERDAASAALDFERSAALHKKIEKVSGVLRSLPELARNVEELSAVVLAPAAAEKTVAVFAVRAGALAEPFLLPFGELASEPRSVEAILREYLEPGSPVAAPPSADGSVAEADRLADHLSLLARWYYGKPRLGEILFFDRGWPYRRIVRACSRLLNAVP